MTEGAGAVALAALYNRRVPAARGKRVVMILSGGNIDVNILSRIIERGLAKDGRLVRLEVQLPDEPGALAALLAEVGGQSGQRDRGPPRAHVLGSGAGPGQSRAHPRDARRRSCAPARGRAPRARFRGHANMAAEPPERAARRRPRAVRARAPASGEARLIVLD